MKRYHFSLDVVLRVRRAQEEAAGFALAQANRHRQQAMDAHKSALARCQALELHRGQQDHMSFHRERDDSERRATAVTTTAQALAAATDVAVSRHAEWSAAATLVAAVERLDERRRQEWHREVQQAEMAAIDESAIAGWRAGVATASPAPGLGARP